MTDTARKAEAEAIFGQLREALAATDESEDWDDWCGPHVEVKQYAEGKPYFVQLRMKGQMIALRPDDAKDFAEELWAAADEADTRMADS
jgi:hypothetical protein